MRGRIMAAFAALALLWAALSCSSRPKEPVFGMGDRTQVGGFVYTVLEAQWADRLGEGPAAQLPSNRFLLVRVSVTNARNRALYVPQLVLVGSNGQEYEELTEVQGVPDWWGVLRKLNPAETGTHWVVFDAPRADYRLRVLDEEDVDSGTRRSALIEIPIRFAANPGAGFRDALK